MKLEMVNAASREADCVR